ncbi:MAG: hypothetical protein SFX73_08670 [Kofleriaceae bacterium]|nr:hypothetical protein [Kofleriaceae bacterium]
MRMRLASLAVCVLSSIAIAAPEATVTLVPTLDEPVFQATISGAPPVVPSAVTLRDAQTGARVVASGVTAYRDAQDAIAIAFVYAGGEVFLGNDDFEPYDSPARYPGFLKDLQRGLDEARLTTLFPATSKAVAIAYATRAEVIAPMGPLEDLHGASLGTQRDYYGKIGAELVAGIEAGLVELGRTNAPRRALVVIGDGNDTNNETAVRALAELKKRAAREGVQTFAIVTKGYLSDDTTVVDRFTSRTRVLASSEALPAALAAIATELAQRFDVTFPSTHVAKDGRPHDLIMSLAGEDLEPVTVQMPSALMPATRACSTWWRQLGIGAALVGLLALGAWVVNRRAAVR